MIRCPIRVLVICGPSGVGKSTLIGKLKEEYTGEFRLAVSHTTRAPREGEEHGVDYFFVTDDEFSKTEFIEQSSFAGNRYGTSKGALGTEGECVILDLNLEGVVNVKKTLKGESSAYMFVQPPSRDELEKRLRGRGISPESFDKRMQEARDLEKNRESVVWDIYIVNDCLDEAFEKLKKFLFPH